MTLDPDRFAALLCDHCLEPRPGQAVVVRSSVLAAPLLLALQRALLEREAHPVLRTSLPGEEAAFARHACDAQLDAPSAVAVAEAEALDAVLTIQAPANTRALADADPARLRRLAAGRAALRETTLAKRWALSIWPTDALAQQAGMSLEGFAEVLGRALLLDRPDPVAAWRALGEAQEALRERLSAARELRLEADGTDLTLRVDGRTWVNSDGRRNMPSGEVFTGPLEDSATGRVRFTIPSSPSGLDVAGVELVFRDGEVVEARAGQGEEHLRSILETDPGARRLGEVGVGTNRGLDRPLGTILLDEKIGGTVHLALGRSYPETGGTNVSAVHWDLVCDLRGGGRLLADGDEIPEAERLLG